MCIRDREEDPGEPGHVLQRPRAVGAPHDVADRLDGLVDRLLRGELLGVAVRSHERSLSAAGDEADIRAAFKARRALKMAHLFLSILSREEAEPSVLYKLNATYQRKESRARAGSGRGH